MLRPLRDQPAMRHPDLLVGVATADDAGVYRLDSSRALVQTVDFFTPIVDEPFDWGRIAAANALSDVYAMGGTPLTALQVVGWPRGVLSFDVLGEVLDGGAAIMGEAGCTIVGGHSIDDQEPKYGFAITGLVDPGRIVSNAGAAVGDALVLTKPLGTGIAATAIKQGSASKRLRDAAVEVMVALNRGAAAAMVQAGVEGATDVTGFGLLGHLRELMDGSDTSAVIEVSAVPALDGIAELAADGVYPGGSERNLESVQPVLDAAAIDEVTIKVLADAQTSGGLLMAVPPAAVDGLLAAVRNEAPWAAVIGEVVDRTNSIITLRG